MSKNKGNVVPPDELIARYGADTERVYTLFIGPPEKDAEWNDRAVEGASKFLNRVWRLVNERLSAVQAYDKNPDSLVGSQLDGPARALHHKTHSCVSKMRRDLARDLHFNTAISSLMELVNEVQAYLREQPEPRGPQQLALGEALHHLVLMLSPMAPHICEELWERLGHTDTILKARFPKADASALEVESITLAVQVNGKIRTRLQVAAGSAAEDIESQALALPEVAASLDGRKPRKVIVVPKRLVNIVG